MSCSERCNPNIQCVHLRCSPLTNKVYHHENKTIHESFKAAKFAELYEVVDQVFGPNGRLKDAQDYLIGRHPYLLKQEQSPFTWHPQGENA
jgi:hypothetical protein